MNPKIEQAIKEGEAILAEKKRLEDEKNAEKLKEQEEYERRSLQAAITWVEDRLPDTIKELTAKGERQYTTHDKWVALAMKQAGWRVVETWIERSMDEGYDFGSYWSYRIHW